jgi:hypothetical protein
MHVISVFVQRFAHHPPTQTHSSCLTSLGGVISDQLRSPVGSGACAGCTETRFGDRSYGVSTPPIRVPIFLHFPLPNGRETDFPAFNCFENSRKQHFFPENDILQLIFRSDCRQFPIQTHLSLGPLTPLLSPVQVSPTLPRATTLVSPLHRTRARPSSAPRHRTDTRVGPLP